MRRFDSIKKSRKKSEDIDEKIEYLNKECQKTGLCEIANSTTGLYSVLGKETNSKHNDFKGLNNDGAPLGFSGAVHNINAEPLDGLKYSPPHPVTGQRRSAQSWFGIASGFGPVAANSDREILWIFDQSLNSGFGDYFSLELTGGSFPFWGTWIDTAFGTSMLVPYNGEYSPLSNAIQNALNNLNINQFLNPEEFGPPTNPILFQNDLGDPTHLPIDLNYLSPQGFNYLKGKAGTNVASEVNYDVYNYLLKTVDDGRAAGWYEENPTLPHTSNPFIPPPLAPYIPLASNPNEPVSDTDIPGDFAGYQDGDEIAFNFGKGKPVDPNKKQNRSTTQNIINYINSNGSMGTLPKGWTKQQAQQFYDNYNNGTLSESLNVDISKKLKIDVRRFDIIKKSRKKSEDIDEKIEYLNKEFRKTNIQEVMTTTNMYFAGKTEPAVPAVNEPVPDSTGVTGDDFAQPLSGDPDDPSNWPDAYTNNDWMFNSDDVGGETGRPIVSTIDSSVIDAYNNAFPDDSRFPAGGAGIVFGDIAFGTAVGYAKGGHFYQVLNPGLFGNGSTKIVPPGSPFSAPWFGMFGMYFPATPELADVIMAMSGAYAKAGGYNPQGALRINLWRNHSRFHDGTYDDYSGKKYTDSEGRRYVLGTFFLHNKTSNTYEVSPEIPPQTIVLQKDDLGNSNFLPIDIDGVSPEAFEYLKGRSNPNTGRGKGDTGDKGDKTTKTDGDMDQDKDQDKDDDAKQELLKNARRIDDRLKKLAIKMTAEDDRNLSAAAFTITIGGTYIVTKFLYPLIAAGIAAGYSLNQLQQLQSDFESNFEDTIIWKSTLSDAEWEKQAQEGREKDAQAAKEANARSEKAEKELEAAEASGNQDRIDRAKEELNNAERNQERVRKVNSENNAARRKARRIRYGTKDNPTGMFNSYKPQGSVLSESVALGHFEPEVLNVDINDLRKGIMPEFPKNPPPEMIGGYSAKSRLVRKDPELPPFIKVTRKDLARNHKLTDKEISEFMNDIKMINDYIKKNPAEFKYAMIRYPKNDPRLAQLNYKMDQMTAASDQYMETHFPENQKLFNKLQQKISNTIGQTDPKNFKDSVTPPQFDNNQLETVQRRKEIIKRHFKKKKG